MRSLIATALTLFIVSASAIEPPKQDKPPASTQTPPTAPAPEAPAPETPAPGTQSPAGTPEPAADEEEETLPPLPPDAVPAGPPPARFNPTEKVRADFPVSFPIDI
jgi:hypothetical protein